MDRLERVATFCERFGLGLPILLAPMAGASAPELSAAVGKAGGMGALGALLMQPSEILDWAATVRASGPGIFQLNLWVPDPAPARDLRHEAEIGAFLSQFGPEPASPATIRLPDFEQQCEALLDANPAAISSVMGLFPPAYVGRLKSRRIAWFAIVSTVTEAKQAEAAGADVIVAQGMEAGGHRAAFNAENADRDMVGLFSLVPAVVDAVRLPVVATGGIADARGIAAALMLGASAAQIGTGFLRCPEARINPAWAEALGQTLPEQTRVSRVFSGRAGRSIATRFVRSATSANAPTPAPYPVQRALTASMRAEALKAVDVEKMQAWAGQSAALASQQPAGQLTQRLWRETQRLLA